MAYYLVLAVFLTLMTKVPVAMAQRTAQGGYDNITPRQQQASLVGWGQRALAAHQNAWEALLLQGLGLLAAMATQEEGQTATMVALFWMFARVVYTLLYIVGQGTFRSVVWAGGMACSVTLMILAIPGVGDH